MSIDIPGEETRFLAEKAKQYVIWLMFGRYDHDKDWPDHVLMLGVLMNPAGEVGQALEGTLQPWARRTRTDHIDGLRCAASLCRNVRLV